MFNGFKAMAQGEDHRGKSLPCQDAVHYEAYKNYGIAIVADGHGSERHFRSQYGSQIAVKVGRAGIFKFQEFLATEKKKLEEKSESAQRSCMEDQLNQLERFIITRWRQEVIKHFSENSLTDQENDICHGLNLDMVDENNQVCAYGTTLIAAMIKSGVWFVIQIGDGKSVVLDAEGNVSFAVDEDERLGFGKTTSLCDVYAKENFRHSFDFCEIKGITVATDGVSDSFIPEAYLEFHRRLYTDFCNDPEIAREGVTKGVAAWSLKGSRDDVAMAGIFVVPGLGSVLGRIIREKLSLMTNSLQKKSGDFHAG